MRRRRMRVRRSQHPAARPEQPVRHLLPPPCHLISEGKRRCPAVLTADVGGGFTYLTNIVPRLLRLDRGSDFLLVSRNERVARCLPQAENLEVRMVRPLGPLGRLAFTFRDGLRLAREWGADLYFSVSEYAPASLPPGRRART